MNITQLTLNDLRLEAQLQQISKNSVPTMETQSNLPTDLLNTPVSDINLRDLGIEEQLQKISKNNMKEVYGWKPTAIKSHVTQEMIQDYQDEVANSFYDDPITGKRLKYVPVSSDLQLEEYRPQGILKDVGISEQTLREQQLFLAGERKRYEQQIVEETERLEYIKGSVEFQEQTAQITKLKQFYDREFLKRNPDLLITTERGYVDYVKRLENEIYEYKARIFEIDAEIARIQEMIDTDERVKRENQAEKDRVYKANQATLQQRSEELNLLNRGRLNLVRQPNESDEDFKQRLLDVGQVEFDEEAITQQAGRRAVNKFKENMKTITRNNILIENMIKSVEPSRLFLYNKYFSAIQTKMKEVYGSATWKENDYDNLLGIFDNIIGKVTLETLPKINLPLPPSYESVVPPPSYESVEGALPPLPELQLPPLPELQLPPLPASALPPLPELRPLPVRPVEPFNRLWVKGRGSENGATFWENTKYNLQEEFKDQYKEVTGRNLPVGRLAMFKAVYETGLLPAPSAPASLQNFQGQAQSGVGLKHEKLPTFAHLGRIAIDPHSLYYQNTLKVLSHQKYHLQGYKNTKVTEGFVSILMDLLKGKFPTGNELKKLDIGEKELYDNLIHLAHLHKKAEHNLPQTRQAMKHRFELLNGEIVAGNTNKALKEELKQLVHKMAYGGMISHVQAQKYVKSL